MQKVFQQTSGFSQASQGRSGLYYDRPCLDHHEPVQAKSWNQPLNGPNPIQGHQLFYSAQETLYPQANDGDEINMPMARGTSAPGALEQDHFRKSGLSTETFAFTIPMMRRHSHHDKSSSLTNQALLSAYLQDRRTTFPTSFSVLGWHPSSMAQPNLDVHPRDFLDSNQTFSDHFDDSAAFLYDANMLSYNITGHQPLGHYLEDPISASGWTYCENVIGPNAQRQDATGIPVQEQQYSAQDCLIVSEPTQTSNALSDANPQNNSLDSVPRNNIGLNDTQSSNSMVNVTSPTFSDSRDFSPLLQNSLSTTASGATICLADNERFPFVSVTNNGVGCHDSSFSFAFPMSSGCSQSEAGQFLEDVVSSGASDVKHVVLPLSHSPHDSISLPEDNSIPRLLAPKPLPREPLLVQKGSSGVQSERQQRGKKRAIAKVAQVRRVEPKLFCELCNKRPAGYRGYHELRRHHNRMHSTVRSMWICVDASEDQKFLANCKACRSGKKYGADYNAASHLRRRHFNKRKGGRGSERRGGIGGGQKPPMEVLRKWMKEVEEISCDNLDDDLIPGDDDEDAQDDDTSSSLSSPSSLPPSPTALSPSALPTPPANQIPLEEDWDRKEHVKV